MDLFKKLFGDKEKPNKNVEEKNPVGSIVVPLEMQKQIEIQMREMFKAFEGFDDDFGDTENEIKQFFDHSMDETIDEIIGNDQIEKFLPTLSSGIATMKTKIPPIKDKPTEEDTIMDFINGTSVVKSTPPRNKRTPMIPNNPTQTPYNKMPMFSPSQFERFNSANPSIKTFGQSVISQTVRKPDGTYENRRITRDIEGNIKTTITKTVDGKTKTFTTYGKGNEYTDIKEDSSVTRYAANSSIVHLDRNLLLNKDGYALPRML